MSEGILANFDVSKIFEIVPNAFIKFDEKHDGVVAEPVRLTVLEFCLNFVQKLIPEPPKIVPSKFLQRIRIRRPRKQPQLQFLPNQTNLCVLS